MAIKYLTCSINGHPFCTSGASPMYKKNCVNVPSPFNTPVLAFQSFPLPFFPFSFSVSFRCKKFFISLFFRCTLQHHRHVSLRFDCLFFFRSLFKKYCTTKKKISKEKSCLTKTQKRLFSQ